jgi:ATP-binding protein involved in chromosome partitioning
MAYFIPHDMPEKKYYIFGKGGAKSLAEEYEVPFLGEIPLKEKLRESADNGTELGDNETELQDAFMHVAKNLAREISIMNSQKQVAN